MSISRYITIQAVKVDDELIPFSDPRVTWEKDDYYGDKVVINGKSYSNFVECIYDLKSHKILPGIEKDFFPKQDELKYKIGQAVLIDRDNNSMQQTKIVDIVFEEYESDFKRGKKITGYLATRFFAADEEIDKNSVYLLKTWLPIYSLENGMKTKYEHQLKHIYQE